MNKKYNLQQAYISVEGNIGSGKSTFLKKIAQSLRFPVVFEPHQAWQDVNGYNILDAFYKDMKRWAYSFQTYVFLTRVKAMEEAMEKSFNENIFISERCVIGDRYTFALLGYEMGMINDLEWNLYCSWYEWLTTKYVYSPAGHIYLKVDPQVAYERINKRKRDEEKQVSLSYITCLHEKHDDWLIAKKNIANNLITVPVLTLDCNKDFEHNDQEWENLMLQVKNFIYSNDIFSSCLAANKYNQKGTIYGNY